MGDQLAIGEEFEKKAEKKLSGWSLFDSKHEDAAELFDKAANCFKLAKSWDKDRSTYVKVTNCNLKVSHLVWGKAGSTYVKIANCNLKTSKHEAAHCYKKTNTKEAISCSEQAMNMLCDIGRLSMAARHYKAIDFYEKAADFFQNEDVSTSANQCKQKVAQFAAQIEQYEKAIEIYEDIARQSLSNNLLKYGVKGHLLNAGICQLCKGDDVAITNALERYQEIASAIDEEDVTKFTDVVKEFDSMTPLLTYGFTMCYTCWTIGSALVNLIQQLCVRVV
ncbi:Alpha-soluble NSF attachment protein [Hibiscus syriacus]|uniref:Alpha-soluble NSF attachment protein n=1 Tax=Hibiscus syriacus TaxID=106335 RepID=A0A6A3BN89_HIBSY|nr:Alpha-soluble NSF attachment protein [Hibiscus syriacus]